MNKWICRGCDDPCIITLSGVNAPFGCIGYGNDGENDPYWEVYESITNADVIRQMSCRELAELITPKVMFCNGCPVKCAEKDIPLRDNNDPFGADVASDVCVKRVEQWLESEVEYE